MSVYNNLILFDHHIAQNRLETMVPDLASIWEWNEDGTELTFTLREPERVEDVRAILRNKARSSVGA